MIHFEAITPVGRVAATFDSEAAAKAFCLKNKLRLPGLSVWRVETTTTRTAVYRPRARRAA